MLSSRESIGLEEQFQDHILDAALHGHVDRYQPAQNVPRHDHTSIGSGGEIMQVVRASADQEVTSTTLASSTELTLPLAGNTEYAFEFIIFFLNDGATEGVQFTLSGTVGVSAIAAQVSIYDDTTNALVAFVRMSSLGQAVSAGISAGSNYAEIKGSILTTTAGTLLLQFAQNAAGASAGVHLEVGSTFRLVKTS